MFADYTYLYVEDDLASRMAVKVIFENVMKVSTLTIFEDSKDFIPKVETLSCIPDLFLLDIQMEPFTGFELLNLLRADPRYDASIIVALTASVMNEEVEQLQEAGFDGAIAKPLTVATFPNLIKRILERENCLARYINLTKRAERINDNA